MSFWYRNFVAASAIAGTFLLESVSVASLPPNPAVPESGKIEFDVYRKDQKIGSHKLTFTQQDDQLQVDINVKFKVKFLFVTVYKYQHRATEIWSGDQLVSLSSETEQNGKEWSLEAVGNEATTFVEVNEERRVVPDRLLPTSYWNVQIVGQSQLLNTQFGTAIDVDITDRGQETVSAMGQDVDAQRYNISAFVEETSQPVNADVWYDMRGELVKLQFVAKDGSVVEYRRVS
ncbi:MAG: DUF6134 family protein [Alphaproteobacteria bacterium]